MWSAFLDRLIINEGGDYVLEIVKNVQNQGIIKPDRVMFISALKVCGLMGSIMILGNILQAQIIENELETEVTVTNTLIDMYSKCGALNEACVLFNNLKTPSIVSWGVMISAYATHGRCSYALRVLKEMQENHVEMSRNIKGQELCLEIAKDGYERDLFLGNVVIDMYAKCSSVTLVRDVVEDLPSQDVISRNTLISGYAKYGPTEEALCLLVVRTYGNDGIPS